jgi:hypothetical protein
MNELLGLIADINPAEIAAHIEQGDLAKWCEIWRQTATVAVLDYNSRSEVPMNADHIRGSIDRKLAQFVATMISNQKFLQLEEQGVVLTALMKTAIVTDVATQLEMWLKQPYKNEGM